MKNQTCCFTGHRKILKNEHIQIKKHLESEITNLIHQGVRYFGVGGALGFDTIAALTVLKLKSEFPHIRLILVLPYKDQAKGWHETDKKIYSHILKNADKAVYTSENYYRGCFYTRNRHLADNAGYCIAYLKKHTGGTAHTVDYALKNGLKVINIAEK